MRSACKRHRRGRHTVAPLGEHHRAATDTDAYPECHCFGEPIGLACGISERIAIGDLRVPTSIGKRFAIHGCERNPFATDAISRAGQCDSDAFAEVNRLEETQAQELTSPHRNLFQVRLFNQLRSETGAARTAKR